MTYLTIEYNVKTSESVTVCPSILVLVLVYQGYSKSIKFSLGSSSLMLVPIYQVGGTGSL